MNQFSKLFFILALGISLMISACTEDPPPEPPNDEEVITTLQATFTPKSGGGTPVVFTYRDLDGDGPDAPTIVNGTLDAGTEYALSLVLLNETNPVDITDPEYNVTLEIAEEAEEHQFFFEIASALNLTITYGDMDADSKPLGLLNDSETTGASSGNLTITLRHEPNKSAAGVEDGDITNAGGETDIEVTFEVTIQ